MKLRNLFREYKPGDVCDGLIAAYRLHTRSLEERGVIQESGGRWVFRGFYQPENKR